MGTTMTETLGRLTLNADPAAYLLSIPTLKNNLSSITDAFKSLYPAFSLAYSFKTNYLKAICDTVFEEGHMAEVVSPAEYDYARTLGFPANRIVYNGVIPDAEEKFKLAASGGYVNVDNLGEYNELAKMAMDRHKPIQLGVRVNLNVNNGIVSRFGIDPTLPEFETIMKDMLVKPYVRFRGFHTHIGSSRQLPYWKEKIDAMIVLAKEYGASYIDLGGGMFGQMPPYLSKQFNGYVSSFNAYAEVVAKAMAEAFPDGSVDLILEPGTAAVGNTMCVAAKVTNIKYARWKTFITVGCCSNHIGMLCDCRDIPCEVYQNPHITEDRIPVSDAIIAGPTCLEFDYIKKGFSGSILPGDIIVFENCGAYSISASRQFIVPRLPVYSAEDGKLLLRAETSSDMLGKYYFC